MSVHDPERETAGDGEAGDSRLSRFEDLAARVSDGVDVDWQVLSDSVPGDEERAVLTQLKVVAEIAEFHRGSQGLTAPDTWGSLELRERLGRGGFAEVYRAYDPALQRDVALKLLGPRRASSARDEALLREGRLLARLRHPSIVTIYGADRHGDRTGLWMEMIRGRTLAEIVREQGPLGAEEASVIGMAVCGALAAIHRTGLVHRDVKAQNVMREEGGRIVLMDLGLGRASSDDLDAGGQESRRLDLAGTPLYMTPELLAGKNATPAADLYALGVMLYYLVTSEFPIEAQDLAGLRRAHAEGRRRALRDVRPDLPREFVEVVGRATAKDPETRFQTAGEMEQALLGATDRSLRASGNGALGTSGDLALRASENRAPRAPEDRTPRTSGERSPWAADRKLPDAGERAPREFSLAGLARTPRGRRVLVAAAVICGVLLATSFAALRGGYEVTASVFRVDGSGERERLDSGNAVSVGDFLGLELRGSRDLYTYVVSSDDRGEAYLLFPLPGFLPQNPLRSGERHLLPGRFHAQSLYWQVSSPGGRERFLIITSPERLRELEESLGQLRTPSEPTMAARITESGRERLRGIGWMGAPQETARPASARESGAVRKIRQLVAGSERARGLWVREIVLANQ